MLNRVPGTEKIPLEKTQQFNYLCTYDLYGPARNVFDAGGKITWGKGGGGGLALEIESFVGPGEIARADRRVLFGAHKTRVCRMVLFLAENPHFDQLV